MSTDEKGLVPKSVLNSFYKVIYGKWGIDQAIDHCNGEYEMHMLLRMLNNWSERVKNYKGPQHSLLHLNQTAETEAYNPYEDPPVDKSE